MLRRTCVVSLVACLTLIAATPASAFPPGVSKVIYETLVNVPGPGKLAISWYQVPKGAKVSAKKKGKKKTVLVASGTKTAKKAGDGRIRVRLTKKGKKVLKRVRKGKTLKLTAKGSFTPTGQKATSVKLGITLKG